MIGSLMMCVSAVLLVTGMLAGIAMGIAQNFQLAPAHAHLNLVGGVLLFLFGLYYRMIPAAGSSRLAQIQGTLHLVGAFVFPAGIALVLLRGASWELAPVTGALGVTLATILFAVVVIRTARAERRAVPAHLAGGPQLASRSQGVHGIVQHSDSHGASWRQRPL